MHPSRTAYGLLVLGVAVLLATIVGAWHTLRLEGLSSESVGTVVLFLLIGLLGFGWSFVEFKVAGSAELSESGVSALTYDWKVRPPFIRFERVQIPWNAVIRLGLSGFQIIVEDATKSISIDTRLFGSYTEVAHYINARSSSEVILGG